MIRTAKAAAIPALLLALGACSVTVDNKTQAQADNASDQLDNAADKAGDQLGNVADAAGNAAGRLGKDVEKDADKIGNGISVHVNLHGDKNDNSSGNSQ
jgi:hypothetical protein